MPDRFISPTFHALTAPIPAALWLVSMACDVLYLVRGEPLFAAASFLSILCGLLVAAMLTPVVAARYSRIESDSPLKRLASTRLTLGLLATVLYVLNFFARHGLEKGIPSSVTTGQVALSAASMALIAAAATLRPDMAQPHPAERDGLDRLEDLQDLEDSRRAA